MYMMAIKASLLLIVIITILGAVQTRPITELMLIFVAGGVIPGTNLVMPAQVILITTAAALMIIIALLARGYLERRTTMRSLVPEYEHEREDPAYSALVPGLSRALAISRALRAHAGDLPPQLYLFLRYVVRRTRTLAAAMREDIRTLAGVIDRRTLGGRMHVRHNVLYGVTAFRRWSTRALAYLMRITTF